MEREIAFHCPVYPIHFALVSPDTAVAKTLQRRLTTVVHAAFLSLALPCPSQQIIKEATERARCAE